MYCRFIFCFFLFNGVPAQFSGYSDTDNGNIQIQPSNFSFVFVIHLQNTTGIRMQLKNLPEETTLLFPEQNLKKTNLRHFWVGRSNGFYNFEGKSLVVVVPPRQHAASFNWTGVKPHESKVSFTTKFVKDFEGTLEWEKTHGGDDRIFWVIEFGGNGQLNWTLETVLPECGFDNPCESISFALFHLQANGNFTEVKRTCEGSSTGSLKVGRSSQVLLLLHVNSSVYASSSINVTWTSEFEHPTTTERGTIEIQVDGILAGTNGGLYAVSLLNPLNPTKLSSKEVHGLAYDWNTRKAYWAEEGRGVVRANLNSSDSEEMMVADPDVRGIAIEPTSGNFYYGSWSKKAIFVCDNDAKRCSNIVEAERIYDIALHPSKGFLFWCSWGFHVFRVNLDGTGKVTMVNGVTEGVYGIFVDERQDRLYWSTGKYDQPRRINSSTLNGEDVTTLLGIFADTADVEIEGDRVYYTRNGNVTPGISFTGKQGVTSTSLVNLPANSSYLAIFGTPASNRGENPCANVKCTHLCILMSATTYRCICPDGESLQEDGVTCE